MELETKFLRLRTPVTIGSRFGDWKVTWLGGWTRHRLTYLVMVARTGPEDVANAKPRKAPELYGSINTRIRSTFSSAAPTRWNR
jgi:hypothetical protein